MSSKVRNFFKEKLQWLSLLKEKKKKNEEEKELKKDSDRESTIKIIIFSPLVILGLIKTGLDSLTTKKVASKSSNLDENNSSTLHNQDKPTLNDKKNNASISSLQTNQSNYNISNIQNQKTVELNPYPINKLEDKPLNLNKNQNKKKKTESYQSPSKKVVSDNSLIKENVNYHYQKEDNMYYLENKILSKIKRSLKSERNSLDVVESELYLINKYEDDENLLLQAKKLQEQIYELLEKINRIKEEYNILKNNNIIEDPLLLNDSLLIDDVIEYREKISKLDQHKFPQKYKLLDDYIYLYNNLEKVKIENERLLEESKKRSEELEKRDKRYVDAKKKIFSVQEVSDSCNKLINEQNAYLLSLNSKVEEITKKTISKTRLRGFNHLITTSLKYIGLLTLTPLKGLIPSIGARTLATRKLIKNLAKNMGYEEINTIVYSAINYESEINNNLYNLKNISANIDETLYDIKNLKEKFKQEFSNSNLKDYEDIYKKIEAIEEQVLDNKERITFIEKQLIKSKKINRNKLIKVKKMNKRS